MQKNNNTLVRKTKRIQNNMNKELRCGLVARSDVGGLGRLSYDFWKNIYEINKELIVLSGRMDNPMKYPKGVICSMGRPTLEEIDEFLKDINMVLIMETPYNWNVVSEAKKRGIKVVIIPNYEWSEPTPMVQPDLYLCPSKLDYDLFKKPKKYLPIPVNRDDFPFKLRTKAETFVFNNGGGGTGGRNGFEELRQAIPLVKSDVNFIVRSQLIVEPIEDNRVKFELANKKPEELYAEGDVFLFPHKFDGLSLPIQEALSSGMPVISTNFYPHNTYMPKEWFFEPKKWQFGKVCPECRVIEMAELDPKKIAEKIDEWAHKDITKDSEKANEIAESISWKSLHDEYIKVFKELL